MLDFESLYVRTAPGSPMHERAARVLDREEELERQEHDGCFHSLVETHPVELEKAADQLRLELTDYDGRANVRAEVARYLERVVLPAEDSPRLRRLVLKLRDARRRCWFQLDTETGSTRTLWDQKAGEPLLCPDDAREEAMRLQRRLEETIGELAQAGYRVYYGVLTIDNAAPGGLRTRIDKLWRKWQRALKARVPNKPGQRLAKAKRARLFPFIGAIATLEAPLGASRTWHPHLNVIVITRGFFDWSAWWAHWGCVSEWKPIKGGPQSVAAAFRELIKYAVRAVPEKSNAKAAARPPAIKQPHEPEPRHPAVVDVVPPAVSGGEGVEARPSPPAMVEWTAAEWLEWWGAMKGRRRTRTYGELFGLNVDPEPATGSWVTIGRALWDGSRFCASFPLLESIPGDKSIRRIRDRRERYFENLTPDPSRMRELAGRLAAWRQRQEFEALKAAEPTTGRH